MLSAKLKEAAGNSADATLYVDDVFSTWLYTGNGSTQTITNGIALAGKGGMVWIKSRSAATNNNLQDTVRGASKAIVSNSNAAQATVASSVTSFSSTGFNIGTNSDYNTSSETYVSWTFREAAKFFDVVTYTGTGSARTIAHSLGVAPGMIIVKCTSTNSTNWQVYSNGLTSAAYSMQLNSTNAQASAPTVWNSTAPTSSVFSVGTDATVNASGGTYVAYLYAHDTSSTGIIQCGSYVPDGSGFATVNLGWEPQYVLFKTATGVGDWVVVDTMRGFDYSNLARLNPNTSAAENPLAGGYFVPTATGFQDKGLFGGSPTVIYMAIRRPNKPPTTGTQVFSPVAFGGSIVAQTISTTITPDSVLTLATLGTSLQHYFNDRLRGATKTLASTSTAAEATTTTAAVSGFDVMGGFYFAIDSNQNNWVAEAFKRAPGFFDVVCYTGTGSATTQAHNLTVAPELMIVKERSAANNWWVYDAVDGNTKYSVLNSTAIPVTSSTAWNNTTPTASVFSIGTATNVNASAQTFVAYLFATLAGISKVGSYTGNGTGQAIACGFGSGGARFVLIKRTDSTGGWYIFDSVRGLTSGSSPYLLLNSTAAETTGNNGVYASSGGFTLGATAITTTNIAAATYIYLSVA
jgi:hypothetical protein